MTRAYRGGDGSFGWAVERSHCLGALLALLLHNVPELVIGASNVLTFKFTDKYDGFPRVYSDPFKIHFECGLVARPHDSTTYEQFMGKYVGRV